MNNLKIKTIECETKGGAEIYACVKEAIQMSIDHDADVRFKFNDEIKIIRYNTIMNILETITTTCNNR